MESQTPLYDLADWGYYFCFGAAICANFQGLLISPILIKKNWKRNISIVAANICYLVSNWIAYGQSGIECSSAGYAVQVTLIFGSIFEAHTPLIRAYNLLTPRWKKAVPFMSIIMIIAQFLTLDKATFICDSEEHQFVTVIHKRAADAIASLFAIYIYILSYSKIIQVIDTNQFGKVNGRMKVIRTLSKYSMVFAILMRMMIALFDIGRLDKNGKVVMAMRSNIVIFLMATQLCLELSKLGTDGSEYSDSDSITNPANQKSVKSKDQKSKSKLKTSEMRSTKKSNTSGINAPSAHK